MGLDVANCQLSIVDWFCTNDVDHAVAVYLALQDREQIRNDRNSNRHDRQVVDHDAKEF
jgi:hypothetical protein